MAEQSNLSSLFLMMEDTFYMARCIELAKKATGNTYPNPLVGSVIVHNGVIIGEGYHKKAGEPHAEINAINSVINPSILSESTIYVSLEPCSHYGKTPPCALKLKEIGFKKVVIGTLDFNEKVNGKGKKILEDAGIEVISGILENECRELNRRFFTFHQKKRPFIILKWAQSGDGFMDKDFKPYQISNALSGQFVHQLRADEQAILVGRQTALADNPSLTVRTVAGKNPIRILIDFDLKVPETAKIFNDEAKTIVFNEMKDSEENHIKFIKISKEDFIENLVKKLYELHIQSVIVEGGSFTLTKFIEKNIWEEAIILKNEELQLEKGTTAPVLIRKPLSIKYLRNDKIEFYKNV